MSISDEINKNYKNYKKPENTNPNTLESVARDIFVRASKKLVSYAKGGYVNTSKGFLSDQKYVECWEPISIGYRSGSRGAVHSYATPGRPIGTEFGEGFHHWEVYDKKDLMSLLGILQKLGAQEGIKVSYKEPSVRGCDGLHFVCYIK